MANRILDTQRASGGNAVFDSNETSGAVSVDLVVVYDVAQAAGAAVNFDLVVAYDVRAQVSADLVVIYDVRKSVSADLVVAYDVAASVGAPVNADLVVAYNVRSSVSADLVVSYDIRIVANADLVVTYNVLSEAPAMSFIPSVARTVVVNTGSKAFTATSDFWTMADPKKPRAPKDPDSTIDITFDWGPWLDDIQAAIASGGVTFITEYGLLTVAYTFVGSKCTIFVSGGDPGKRAGITCRIMTDSVPARIEDRTIYLDVEQR